MVPPHSALERLLRVTEGNIPAEFARRLLSLSFTDEDQSRYRALSNKAQLNELSSEERIELDDLLTANDVLTILRSKAEISLKNLPAA